MINSNLQHKSSQLVACAFSNTASLDSTPPLVSSVLLLHDFGGILTITVYLTV